MVIEVMCRASLRSCRKRRTTSDMPSNGVNVIQTGLADIGSGKRLAVDVHWRLFIEPNPTQRLTLKFLAARKIAFQADDRLAAEDVIDFDAVEQVGNATRRDKLRNGVLRDRSGSSLAGAPNKHALHGIANDFASNTARPSDRRTVKAFTLPPLGIAPGSVHCRLETACQGFAKLIAGHQQSLAMCAAGSVKIKLLGIGTVIP